jgi:hypothetical protein
VGRGVVAVVAIPQEQLVAVAAGPEVADDDCVGSDPEVAHRPVGAAVARPAEHDPLAGLSVPEQDVADESVAVEIGGDRVLVTRL